MRSIVLAAGYGARFASHGYTTIKPLLPMPDGRPVLQWIRDMLPSDHQTLVARCVDMPALLSWTDGMDTVWVDDPPIGPLACLAQAPIVANEELLISHCDSLLYERADLFLAAARASVCDMAIVTFPSDDPRYGYWDGARIVEKQAVSPYAVAGLYYFRCEQMVLDRLRHADPSAGVWSLMTGDVYVYSVARAIDVGTPADYEAFMSEASVA